jgi:hypothetical protein
MHSHERAIRLLCTRVPKHARTEPCRVMQPLFQHEHPLLILPDWMHDHEQAREDLYGRWASEAQQHPVGCACCELVHLLTFFSSRIEARDESADGATTKLAVALSVNLQEETVLMRHGNRTTKCVSSQMGCANMLGCSFCATGTMGVVGDLSAGEIVEQLLHSRRLERADRHGGAAGAAGAAGPTEEKVEADASLCRAGRRRLPPHPHRRRVHRGRHRSRHHTSLTAATAAAIADAPRRKCTRCGVAAAAVAAVSGVRNGSVH